LSSAGKLTALFVHPSSSGKDYVSIEDTVVVGLASEG
jgi:hypothetical protein